MPVCRPVRGPGPDALRLGRPGRGLLSRAGDARSTRADPVSRLRLAVHARPAVSPRGTAEPFWRLAVARPARRRPDQPCRARARPVPGVSHFCTTGDCGAAVTVHPGWAGPRPVDVGAASGL